MMPYYEKKVADGIMNSINVMGFSMDGVCDAMSHEHRTLQADFTRLCVQWIRKAATQYDSGDYDARNELECRAASRIVNGEFDW